MRPGSRVALRAAGVLLLLAPTLQLASGARLHAAPRLPPLVFVSRAPAEDRAQVPGLGPGGRALATGGVLMVRGSDATVRPLIGPGELFDVSDPCVSWDGTRIVFAGTPARERPWRIYVIGADGRGLRAITRSDRAIDLSPLGIDSARFGRYDDFDPCWLPDGRVCFASTRFPEIAERGGVPSTNLFLVGAEGGTPERITSERNGAEEPVVDPATGRIVYARWWFNRYLASEIEPSGVTTDRSCAVPADTVDLWHAVSVRPDGTDIKLAGGDPRGRATAMAYQPLVLGDGTLIGVRAENLALMPSAGRAVIQGFPGGFAEGRMLAGGGRHGESACSPAVLPDGRLVLSLDRTGSGDFGLYVMNADGSGLQRLVDLRGTLELDAAAISPRPRPSRVTALMNGPLPDLPFTRVDQLHEGRHTFRFDCLNVFANGAVDRPFPDAPRMERNLRIRFFGVLSRPASAGGDTVVLVREGRVTAAGAVHEDDLPADTPLFEQLVDDHGRVLRSASGPAHVPGFNFARSGSGSQCVGCHAGHSGLPVPPSAGLAKWVNATPSAAIHASSEAPGTVGAAGIADRRTVGPPERVAWVALGQMGEMLQLQWPWPIEVREVVVYPIRRDERHGTDLRIGECELLLLRAGREVGRRRLLGPLRPTGTHADCNGILVDEIHVLPTRVSGRILRRPAVALAEVETIARLLER